MDLTDKQGKYTLSVDAEISTAGSGYGYGYVSISNKPDNTYSINSTSYGNLISITNTTKKIATMDIAGGQKYYLNFKYSNTRKSFGKDDELKINSVTLTKKQEGNLTLTSGTVEIAKTGTSREFYSAIDNGGMANIKGGTVTSSNNYTAGVTTLKGGTSNIDGGNINLTGSNDRAIWSRESGSLTKVISGNIYAYEGVVTSQFTGNVVITGGEFSDKCQSQINNAGSYSSIMLQDMTLTNTTSGRIINTNTSYTDITINNCNLSNSNSSSGNGAIYVNGSYSNIQIDKSEITGRQAIYCYQSANLSLNECTIKTTSTPIYCYRNNNNVDINKTTITAEGDTDIINFSSTVNATITDSTLNNETSKSKKQGITLGRWYTKYKRKH